MLSIIKDLKLSRQANDAGVGTADVSSAAALDMAGFDSVLFFACLGDVTSGCVLTFTVYSAATAVVSGGASEGATAARTAGSTDSDNGILAVEVHRPVGRYVYATLNRTTQNAIVDGIFAIQFNANKLPPVQDASLLLASFFVNN